MASVTLWPYSAEILFLFRVCRGLRAAPNALSQFGLRFSFTFVLVFPVYRISAKGARAENPHETKG